MTEHLLPIVYVTLGSEMIFILEQRIACAPRSEKAGRVQLKKCIRKVFGKATVEEVFKTRQMPTKKLFRRVFLQMIEKTDMRVNEPSMDKLFELMMITSKYSVYSIECGEQIIAVTANHLQGLVDMFPDDAEILEIAEHTFTVIFTMYRGLNPTDWHLLRCGLKAYFQSTRVKLTLLMRDGKQSDEGWFYTAKFGEEITLPKDGEAPGSILYFDHGVVTHETTFPTYYQFKPFPLRLDHLNVDERSTKAGQNLYKNERNIEINGGQGGEPREEHEGNELALLESMFDTVETGADVETFEFSMFEDAAEENRYVEECQRIERIDASLKKKSLSSALSEMNLDGATTANKPSKGKGFDLLDMMDEAAAAEEKPRVRRTNSAKGKSSGGRSRSISQQPSATSKRAKSTRRN